MTTSTEKSSRQGRNSPVYPELQHIQVSCMTHPDVYIMILMNLQ